MGGGTPSGNLGCSYPLDQVILFLLRFGSDGKSIQDARAKGISDSLRWPTAKVSLAQNLHSNDALSLRSHLLDHPDNDIRISIHMRSNRVQANKIDLDPRRSRSRTQCRKTMARDAVGSNDALLLSLRQNVHNAAVTRSPVSLGDTVDEHDVNMVDAKLSPEAIKVGTNAGGISSIGLGEYGNLSRGSCFNAAAT